MCGLLNDNLNVIREALESRRRHTAELESINDYFNGAGYTKDEIARIDAALLALDEAAIPADVMQVAIECIDSERNATANMMDAWNEKNDRYKRYAAEVARYEMALMWFEQRKRQPAREGDA